MAYFTGSAAPTTTPLAVGDVFKDTVSGNTYTAKNTIDSGGWVLEVATDIKDGSVVDADFSSAATIKHCSTFQVGFAALNTAGTGVAALFGTAIPDNAIICKVLVDITQTFAGDGDDGSSIKAGFETTNDAIDSNIISDGTPWDVQIKDGVPDGGANTMVKLTAARQLGVTWTAGGTDTAIAAGAMTVFVEWVQGV